MKQFVFSGTLHPIAPFDFAQSMAFLGHFPAMRGEQAVTEQALVKAFVDAGQAVGVRVVATGTVDEPVLAYTCMAQCALDAAAQARLVDRLRFFLSVDEDLRPFYAIGKGDPHFAPVVDQLYGLHQVKFPTPFENAVWAVLTQRTPMAVAQRVKQALTARYGGSIVVDGATHWGFPEPSTLAVADPDELRQLIGQDRRAAVVQGLAVAFAAVDETWLRAAPWEEVYRWLIALNGIGPWSATFVLIRGLGRMEQVPVGEGRLNEAVARVYGLRPPVSNATIKELAAPYGAWQGYWAHYLRAAS